MKKDESVAIFPGSFDPITKGHEEIARRSLGLADRVIVAVARTATKSKRELFSVDERVELVDRVFANDERISGRSFDGLLVDFARRSGARVVVRGLRAISDFEYEMQMAQMNRGLRPEIETVFLVPDASYSFLSSSLVREVATLGGDVSAFLNPVVLARVHDRLGSNFIRAQVSTTGRSPVQAKVQDDPTPPEPDGQTQPSVTFDGQTETFRNGVEVMRAVFTKLASSDSDFCERFSQQYRGRVRSYVAKSAALLYPGKPEFERYSISLPGGWWLATHCSNRDKVKRIRNACAVAGLEFGRNLKVCLPTRSRVGKS